MKAGQWVWCLDEFKAVRQARQRQRAHVGGDLLHQALAWGAEAAPGEQPFGAGDADLGQQVTVKMVRRTERPRRAMASTEGQYGCCFESWNAASNNAFTPRGS